MMTALSSFDIRKATLSEAIAHYKREAFSDSPSIKVRNANHSKDTGYWFRAELNLSAWVGRIDDLSHGDENKAAAAWNIVMMALEGVLAEEWKGIGDKVFCRTVLIRKDE